MSGIYLRTKCAEIMRDDIWHNEGMVFKPEPLQEHCMTVSAQIGQTDKYLTQVLKNMENADSFLRRKNT